MNYITPSILLDDGTTYYPPGWIWVLAFAIAGCQWAIDDINSGKYDGHLQVGAYI